MLSWQFIIGVSQTVARVCYCLFKIRLDLDIVLQKEQSMEFYILVHFYVKSNLFNSSYFPLSCAIFRITL